MLLLLLLIVLVDVEGRRLENQVDILEGMVSGFLKDPGGADCGKPLRGKDGTDALR